MIGGINMTGITANNGALRRTLELTQRKQTIAGKNQEQVTACILRSNGTLLSTTSLVRDGKTSLAQFNLPCDDSATAICVPDINRLMGVLNAHSSPVNIFTDGNKIRVKSGSKQTTLTGDLGGLAFPHSTETIGEWESKSVDLSARLNIEEGSYTMMDGSSRGPFCRFVVEAVELFEALRCDSINGQKLNRYRFRVDADGLFVEVGDDLKGRTISELLSFADDESISTRNTGYDQHWEWDFEGGLEGVVKPFSGEVKLNFIDFRPEGQGIRLLMVLPGNSWVFQAGVLE